ncbi:MAG: outer membrane lipoprotein carrier protein LolA [Acidobacteria bacterium]|nr:outer membrane lipoprotein carrier protein LolA [Acidobacteriota bacterium]
MSKTIRLLTVLLLFASATGLSADSRIKGTKIEEVLAEIDTRQKDLRSLEANFRQTKEVGLLAGPEVSTGVFQYQKPNRVLWKYVEPRPVTMVIANGSMTTWYPELEKAERMEVKSFENRIFRYMGAGTGAIRELGKYFDFRFIEDRIKNEYILELAPKTRTLEKRIKSITIWIDGETYFTNGFEYVEGDGDLTRFEFSNVKMNPRLAADAFELAIPEHVEIETIRLER